MKRRSPRRFLALAVLSLAAAAPAQAAAAPLDLGTCRAIGDLHQCEGLVRTWDGVPLDATVTAPSAAVRRRPLIVLLHGFGNSKHEYLDPNSSAYTGNAFEFARRGYLVLTYTARGLWGSCGTPEARLTSPVACAAGYIRLADIRYEARDTQTLIGRLVDQGFADPRRIGVTGDSYGGGQSLELAALNSRTARPDGRLVRWRSPAGRPLALAAAAPVIPWSDLLSAIAPNGRTLSGVPSPPRSSSRPVGVEKLSFASGVFAAAQNATGPGQPVGEPFVPGRPMGYLAPPGLDPEADVAGWVGRATLGEPYTDRLAAETVSQLSRFHSPYHVDPARRPPPLLISSGFTDDLFPVGEALRYAERTRRLHPAVPLSLLFGDFGHQRAQNKPADRELLESRIASFFDWHLRGRGRAPIGKAEALTQTCPRSERSRGPFAARTFAALATRSVRLRDETAHRVFSLAGSPTVGAAIDPVAGGGNACAQVAADDQPGVASYRLPTVAGGGAYTMLGVPRVGVRVAVSGARPEDAQIVARLWDVAANGRTQTLVARGLYRPTGRGIERFELNPNGWRFAPGHTPKLELLGNDTPFARPSNALFSLTLTDLRLSLPVRAPK